MKSLKVRPGHGQDILGELLVGRDDKVTPRKHPGCKTRGVNAGGMEILEHGPRLPAAHEAGVQWVNPGPDEGHAASIAEGSGGDVAGGEAKGGAKDDTARFESCCNHAGCHSVRARLIIVGV